MKRIVVLTFLFLTAMTMYSSARTQYDSTGRHIIYDDSLRAQKHRAQERNINQVRAAAGAKINYEEEEHLTTAKLPPAESNYYQDQIQDK